MPPIPSGFSRLWLGPATNPSSDIEIFRRSFDMSGRALCQCALESVPRQQRALHARGKSGHARKRTERAELRIIGGRGITEHQTPELLPDRVDLLRALALHELGHHRGGCLGDRTAPPRKLEIAHAIALERDLKSDLVAAERILHLHTGVRLLERSLVPRPSVVVEDHLLVERADLSCASSLRHRTSRSGRCYYACT